MVPETLKEALFERLTKVLVFPVSPIVRFPAVMCKEEPDPESAIESVSPVPGNDDELLAKPIPPALSTSWPLLITRL